MKIQPRDRRVQKYLDRHLCSPAYRWDDLTDPRGRRGRRWPLRELVSALFVGLLSCAGSLREVEDLTEDLGPTGRQYVSRRVPDTTLWDVIPRLSIAELREKNCAQVRAAWRRKSLRPELLPCGVVAIDGKGLGALEHDAGGLAQKAHRSHDGSPYYLSRMIRAVLISAEAKPCLDQMPVAAKTNEMGAFATFFEGLCEAYGQGALFEIVTGDAGFTSLANATLVNNHGKGYVFALKETQPELIAEARRLLAKRDTPDEQTPWEVYQGKRIQRRLYRTTEIAGYHGWDHLRQVWRVEQEIRHPDGRVEHEQRYFVTNLPKGRLSRSQILVVIRGHWGIENHCNWTFDMLWREDEVPWCGSGRSVEVLSWLRLMAYNLLQQARRRHLRRKRPDGTCEAPPAWRRVLMWVRHAWQLPALHPQESPACG